MIKSKEDYIRYLHEDKKALNIEHNRPRIFRDEIWKYQILMRKCEYIYNCKNSTIYRLYGIILKVKYKKIGYKYGFTIPLNTFGSGLRIAHIGNIVINKKVKVGKNCTVHIGVNIGDKNGCPTIGDNVYIGPGAKIFGNIKVADGTSIGANAVVNKSFINKGLSVAGVPAKVVGKIND
jgi:serine O-acetyltransferase